MTNKITRLTGTVLDENTSFSLSRLCQVCKVRAELIEDMIDEGLITPRSGASAEWYFSSIEVRRVQIAIRLHNDLRINIPGAALVLDLLDEVEELRRRLP